MIWISAQDLDRWARTQVGRTEVARLVGQLVCASAPRVGSFRFPRGDSADIPGYDGHLIAEGVPPFVPDGESVWEFGTGQDYLGKANDDYEKRTTDPACVDPRKSTFVFVTPRQWSRNNPTLAEWENEKNAEQKWKAVRVIDAIALEHWLEQHEAVAKDVARQLLGSVPETGVRSIREFWEEYAERFRPLLREQALLCERIEQAEILVKQLASGAPQAIRLQADSCDEVVAFVVAAIRNAEPAAKVYLEARTLVLDTEEAARRSKGKSNMIFLPRDAALSLSGSLAHHAPTVIPLARDESGATLLRRPSSFALGQEIAKMGMTEEEGQRVARECGRSVTILARRIASGKAPEPPWLKTHDLVPALLAGGWNAANEFDRKAVASLAGREYEDFEEWIIPLLVERDPLEREGSIWKVRAPVEAFEQLGSLITLRDLDRLRVVANEVFGKIDPALDLSPTERLYASIQGKTVAHSDWLRDGLATTLLHLAVLHAQARVRIAGTDPEHFVNVLIENLSGLKENARLLMSLQCQIPLLMEAAPPPLLVALEHLLEGDGSGILPIFEECDTLFPRSSHTELLWALESLAWDPEYLERATLDLAKLARIDPGGRLANRPANSLTSVFKAWLPQTNATLVQRLAAIDRIIAKEPETAWELILSLLPVHHGFGMPTPRPRLREAGASTREILTNGLVFTTYREIVRRAITLAQGSPGRLLVLVQSMPPFEIDEMAQVCDQIERLAGYSANQQTKLWAGLRDVVNRHGAFEDAKWVLPSQIRSRLAVLQKRFEPTDTILRIGWLFDKAYPNLPNVKQTEQIDAVEAERVSAIQRLRSSQGDRSIVELARKVKFPGLVGNAAAGSLQDIESFDQMIDCATDGAPEPFLAALSSVARARFGTAWEARVAARASTGFSPYQVATLLLAWDHERAAWDLAASLGDDTVRSYWSRRLPFPVRGEIADLERAGREYLHAGHALAAIQSLYNEVDKLSGGLVLNMLDRALNEIAALGSEFDGNIAYDIEAVFDKLDTRNDMEVLEVAKREFAYLPLLSHRNRTLSLHRLMVSDPNFFVSVLCSVFKPASGGESEPSAQTKATAQHGYEVLSSFTLVPGFGVPPDEAELQKWVTEVRKIAEQQDRARIADQYIGQVLAHAPVDPDDNAWPHRNVRDLLEYLQSDEIENGVEIARNMLGAHVIDPKNPAADERHLAAEARGWATATVRWPRTTIMLRAMASHWESLAETFEQRARQEAMHD